ncbi:hypothetical protein ACYZTM_03185 [Pseudomonas sp. MDT2-39-1]
MKKHTSIDQSLSSSDLSACTTVAVVGDDVRTQHLVQPLVSLLTEGLMAGGSLTV